MGMVTPREVWPWRCHHRCRDAHGDATRGQVAMEWQCQWAWQYDSDRPCMRPGRGGSVPTPWGGPPLPSQFGWILVPVPWGLAWCHHQCQSPAWGHMGMGAHGVRTTSGDRGNWAPWGIVPGQHLPPHIPKVIIPQTMTPKPFPSPSTHHHLPPITPKFPLPLTPTLPPLHLPHLSYPVPPASPWCCCCGVPSSCPCRTGIAAG